MLYPSELSSGGRTGIEPVASGFRRGSTSEQSSARGTTRPGSRAYATAPPRAPDGCSFQATNPNRWTSIRRRSALPPVARRQFIGNASPPPVPKHPGTALLRLSSVPFFGPACPDASGRDAPRKPCLLSLESVCERQKIRPRVLEPEGVRLPREIGVTDLPCVRRSVDGAGFVANSRRQRERVQAVAGWPQRVTLCNVEIGFHDEAMIERTLAGSEGRARYADG